MWQGGVWLGGHAWQGEGSGRESMVGGVAHMPTLPQPILRDTVNERSVRILLECILVAQMLLQY